MTIQSIRVAAEQRAEQFAKRQGKAFTVLGERISPPPYVLGNFPRIEIVFALIDPPPSEVPAAGAGSNYDKLSQLKTLLDRGALTQEEFEREKQKLLR